MLSRVLEEEVMDTPDEAAGYDTMDHREVNRSFVDDLLAAAAGGAGLSDCEILDLGTGTAQIPIELCGRAAKANVVAVDAAGEMLRIARENIEAAALTHCVSLHRVDAKCLPYASGRFAVVMSNSIVHHIPNPAAVLGEAVRVLATGGLIFFRDLLRPENDASVGHLVDLYAAEATDPQRKMFDDSLRAALSLDEIRQLVSDLGLAADRVTATTDRHWTWQDRLES